MALKIKQTFLSLVMPLMALTAHGQQKNNTAEAQRHTKYYDVVVKPNGYQLQTVTAAEDADYTRIDTAFSNTFEIVGALTSENYTLIGVKSKSPNKQRDVYRKFVSTLEDCDNIFIVPKDRNEAFELPVFQSSHSQAEFEVESVGRFLNAFDYSIQQNPDATEAEHAEGLDWQATAEDQKPVAFSFTFPDSLSTGKLAYYEVSKATGVDFAAEAVENGELLAYVRAANSVKDRDTLFKINQENIQRYPAYDYYGIPSPRTYGVYDPISLVQISIEKTHDTIETIYLESDTHQIVKFADAGNNEHLYYKLYGFDPAIARKIHAKSNPQDYITPFKPVLK